MHTAESLPEYTRDNPSPRYRALIGQYQALHANGSPEQGIPAREMFPGQSLLEHVNPLIELFSQYGFSSMLDYGCGKAMLYRPVNEIVLADGRVCACLQEVFGVDVVLYDPAYLPYAVRPSAQAELVVCTDVLEHCSGEDLPWILDDLFSLSSRFVYANIACYPAHKTLPNGENAHCTVADVDWWSGLIETAAAGHLERGYRFVCTLGDGTQHIISNAR